MKMTAEQRVSEAIESFPSGTIMLPCLPTTRELLAPTVQDADGVVLAAFSIGRG